ncbi:50S ribosomal protein P1 [Candidatus Micrarchaeota archaeon]|nr:50S ribosomal protein P1 [Candidatus Micrarchaeota archaeon]MBU1929935.1 50S ribosomal protein P1 [Candidatus Micrarchaeota archaeon]
MEYVYAAMLLHAAKKEISAKAVTDILTAAGVTPDAGRVKALIASLKDLNIEEAIKAAAVAPIASAAPASTSAGDGKKEKEEDSEEDHAKSEAAAAEGLGALFG